MPTFSKPLKIDEIAAQLLKDGKAPDKEIALLMARKERARQVAKTAAMELKKAQTKQKHTKAEEERKARTHRLIQLGGLVEKSGIGDADHAELFGWLLRFKQATQEMKDSCRVQGVKAMNTKEAISSSGAPSAPRADAHYLNVPIEEKDEAKALGAKWNPELKQWYCNPADASKFSKWFPREG